MLLRLLMAKPIAEQALALGAITIPVISVTTRAGMLKVKVLLAPMEGMLFFLQQKWVWRLVKTSYSAQVQNI